MHHLYAFATMNAFLQELAEEIYNSHADLSKVTVVFPNRRAVLYFRKYLGELMAIGQSF
jgi:hypothetical protein